MNNELKLGHLKLIAIALRSQPVSRATLETIAIVDNMLAATYNVKAVYVSKPRRPYQRQADGEYVFEEMTAHDHEVLQHKTDLVTRNI
jgi:hypothetical protein